MRTKGQDHGTLTGGVTESNKEVTQKRFRTSPKQQNTPQTFQYGKWQSYKNRGIQGVPILTPQLQHLPSTAQPCLFYPPFYLLPHFMSQKGPLRSSRSVTSFIDK